MADVLDSLPDRPLTTTEVAALNDADALDLALPVETEEAVRTEDDEPVEIATGVILATPGRVTGVVHDDGWTVVAAEPAGDDRTDALVACEDAVEDALKPGERADLDERTD
ncbi:hypothetical protein [Halocalculus aciditolerans]|uniref:DUF7964 domain-containing protein n=1 Tax=Halocalculus aciditolerans TaxID=1383812 RepID=A0A830F7D5_9EURY|nr:hypothetical protein [Halocalculus aciditolerans]GGL61654.1 hypothetical protein GCM10009039_19820 [Halocalculus aciditolerans]